VQPELTLKSFSETINCQRRRLRFSSSSL